MLLTFDILILCHSQLLQTRTFLHQEVYFPLSKASPFFEGASIEPQEEPPFPTSSLKVLIDRHLCSRISLTYLLVFVLYLDNISVLWLRLLLGTFGRLLGSSAAFCCPPVLPFSPGFASACGSRLLGLPEVPRWSSQSELQCSADNSAVRTPRRSHSLACSLALSAASSKATPPGALSRGTLMTSRWKEEQLQLFYWETSPSLWMEEGRMIWSENDKFYIISIIDFNIFNASYYGTRIKEHISLSRKLNFDFNNIYVLVLWLMKLES